VGIFEQEVIFSSPVKREVVKRIAHDVPAPRQLLLQEREHVTLASSTLDLEIDPLKGRK